ncbi:MAG: HAMP domain-containing histidine kinase [Candidatus Eremiobacteraeota bacterium]|nr:HAMP domain-containing histidine kinase [Candidatus Eremiobacteraeota bacterium]
MFTSFSRRLTSWYVVAASALVGLMLAACALVALSFYIHLIAETIDGDAREAAAFSARALARHAAFFPSALEIEARLARPGIRIFAAQPPALPPRRRAGERLGPPPPRPVLVNGRIVQGDDRAMRLEGSRLGFAIATAFGAHFQRVDFVDGALFLQPDPAATQRVALWLFAGALAVALLAGLIAWLTGRYITSQVLRPLIDVTHALQRFAAGDFRPQPIAVAGKSEFDAIALAYNAAAAQVALAFAKREQAEHQMRQFVADAGHELRTPLTIVLGYIDLLRRRAEAGDERSRRIFGAIATEGARMRTLIDNLVLLARMEGEDRRPVEPFALVPLLDEVAESRRVVAPSTPIDVDAEVDATVIGDRDEIHEAIANVVDNALKYAPRSPVRIRVRAVDAGVEVTIADRGPGIPPEDRDQIFDRFYRGASRGEIEGSGLGLAIAKRAVERAGGTLVLAEASPAGTTFALRLRADVTTARAPSRR